MTSSTQVGIMQTMNSEANMKNDEKENEELMKEEQERTKQSVKEANETQSSKMHPLVVKPGDDVPKWFSRRWIFCYVSLFGMMFVFVVRVGMSVAIVCMVKRNGNNNYTNLTIQPTCSSNNENLNEPDRGEFEWSEFLVANILAGFFYGYIFTNLVGGLLADKYGGRRVFGYSLLTSGLLLLLYPVMSRVSGYWTLTLRIISGLFSGPFFPAMHSLWGRWAPPIERSRLIAISYSGPLLGSFVTMTLSGYLCANGFDNGWGSVFYLTGGAAFLYSLLWFYLVYDSPQIHPHITKKELDFLEKAIQCQNRVKNIPWRSILTSKAVWAIIVCHFCFNWSIFTLQTVLPLFMKDVLNFSIRTNGFTSSVPYVGQFMSYFLVSSLSDFVIRRGFLKIRTIRILMQCISFIGTASFFIATSFIECSNAVVAVVFLFFVGGFLGFSSVGFMVNHVDIAPSYAGVLFGLTNTISAIPGFLAPTLAGALTPNKTQEEWQHVFLVCSAFAVLGTIVFALFARGEIQEWARGSHKENTKMEEDNISF